MKPFFRFLCSLVFLCGIGFSIQGVFAQPERALSATDSILISDWLEKANAQVNKGAYEEAQKNLDSALNRSQMLKNEWWIQKITSMRGVKFRIQGEYDSALYYGNEAMTRSLQLNDSTLIGKSYLNLGLANMRKGLFNKAQNHLYTALHIFEKAGDEKNAGLVNINLGIFYGMNGNDSMAIQTFGNAAHTFRNLGEPGQLSYALINLGNAHNSNGEYESAVKALKEGLTILESHPDDRAKMNCLNQIGRAYMNTEQAEGGLVYLAEALKMAESSQNTYYLYLSNNYYAQALTFLDRNREALEYAKKAKTYSDKMGAHQEAPNTLETLFSTYEKLGRFKEAFYTLKEFRSVNDSLFNVAKSRQMARMQTEFETDRKEKEIDKLALEAKTERIKRNALTMGLIATLVLGFLIFWNQHTKRKKDREIGRQQKEVEAQKLRNAQLEKTYLETELSFKQRELEQKEKELSSQILQLARKNEFLRSLGEEVDKIAPFVAEEGSAMSRGLARTITKNLNQEAEWEVFLESFRSVHKDFFAQLNAQHPGLSSNELRLIALMKMNLSGKEIANLLHVTDAAIKKSRYRLRKKLGFSSEVNLQSYFLAQKFA